MRIINTSVVFLTFKCLMVINILIMLQIISSYKEKQLHFLFSQHFEHVLSLLRKDFSFFLLISDNYYHLMYVQ